MVFETKTICAIVVEARRNAGHVMISDDALVISAGDEVTDLLKRANMLSGGRPVTDVLRGSEMKIWELHWVYVSVCIQQSM